MPRGTGDCTPICRRSEDPSISQLCEALSCRRSAAKGLKSMQRSTTQGIHGMRGRLTIAWQV